jgi:hypothetical protein
MNRQAGESRRGIGLAVAVLLAATWGAPSAYSAPRIGGGGGGRVAAGSSVRQSSVQAGYGASVNRAAVPVRPATPRAAPTPRATATPRAGDLDRNAYGDGYAQRDVARDSSVHNRDWNGGDLEAAYIGDNGAYLRGDDHSVWVSEDGVAIRENDGIGLGGAIAVGSMIATLPYGYSEVYYDGSPYYYDDSGYYYEEVYSGDEVAYQVVPPPVGALVDRLPENCLEYEKGGVTYQVCDGISYKADAGGWRVVD